MRLSVSTYSYGSYINEENLGFTYAELDRYIRTGEIDDKDIKELIDRKHRMNLFKLEMMPAFKPEM